MKKGEKVVKQVQYDRKYYVKKQLAFTLAETLITLSILGLVAAVTVPSLVPKFQDRMQISAFKRAYSLVDNALQQMILMEGPLNTWNWPDPDKSSKENNQYIAEVLAKYLDVQKFCGTEKGCSNYGYTRSGYQSGQFKNLKGIIGNYDGYGNEYNSLGKMILSNSVILQVGYNPSAPIYYSTAIVIDTNGAKKPNRYGYDVFHIALNSKGLDLSRRTTSNLCDKNSDAANNGWSCYYWILRHNNMDYKYRDVSSEW